MKKPALLFLPFLCLLFSCHRESKNRFSQWYVGVDSFASNNVAVQVTHRDPLRGGNDGVNLKCMDSRNTFAIAFYYTTVLPNNGPYPLYIYNGSGLLFASEADIAIAYTSGSEYKFYTPSPSATTQLSASLVNGKVQYILPPTWFINYFNLNDSALIHGVFNQP